MMHKETLRIVIAGTGLILIFFFSFLGESLVVNPQQVETPTPQDGRVLYTGKIYHIFFHSLVVYPELAFRNDAKGKIYEDYMVTRDQFEKILTNLYQNNFVLVDIHSIYEVDSAGKVLPKKLFLPPGKKPLILSLDDLNYYDFMQGRGFADKLVLDQKGRVATEIILPSGQAATTRDGDAVPIVDDFVEAHPDFSLAGGKGVIALTGFQGVLGYRTQADNFFSRRSEIYLAKAVISALKKEGWRFASHSYSHDHSFQLGKISLAQVEADSQKWEEEVEPLIGPTDIYIGPFGQIFQVDDARRQYLLETGYKFFAGVGLDQYLRYFPNYIVMDRADIDGYQLTHRRAVLEKNFSIIIK